MERVRVRTFSRLTEYAHQKYYQNVVISLPDIPQGSDLPSHNIHGDICSNTCELQLMPLQESLQFPHYLAQSYQPFMNREPHTDALNTCGPLPVVVLGLSWPLCKTFCGPPVFVCETKLVITFRHLNFKPQCIQHWKLFVFISNTWHSISH